MSQQSAARERLIDEWRKSYAEASTAAEVAGSHAVWMARLKVRLYWFLLSLYGDGQWNGSAQTKPTENQQPQPSGEPLALDGKPAKSVGAIRAALKSVSGACEGNLQRGPLVAGYGSEAWVVVASSGSGIDADKCGHFLKQQGVMPRIVHGKHEATVAVRSIHESIARRLVAEQHARFELSAVIPNPRICSKTEPGARIALPRYIAWGLLLTPAWALILWQNVVTFWPDIPSPLTELNFIAAVPICALLLFELFLRDR